MFAGIVEAVGRVEQVGTTARRASAGGAAHRLAVSAPGLFQSTPLGASIAINGVCLTVCAPPTDTALFDVIPETWQASNLHALRVGDAVNVERSLRVGDRIDGHFVQGHVDSVARIARIDQSGSQWKLRVSLIAELRPFVVRKGSIAIDGVSLTIVDVTADTFSVALIPTTLAQTVLGRRQAGDAVNIETDILARLIVSRLADLGIGTEPDTGHAGGLTVEALRAGGFA